ncbi:MAG: protein translocase subunit SecD [Opitutales bacterium]|nr:protein translocase subunit SecD [Opitutales bacterium]MCH8540457.1 protein translocase subunit SecD [Opitutales bacterium]
MNGPLITKFIFIAATLGFAIAMLLPLRETPFEEFVQGHVTAHQEEWAELDQRVRERMQVDEDTHVSYFVALREIASEDRLDLTRFFPQHRVESTVRSIEQRNNIVLNFLLGQSQPNLNLGLDLRGGVSMVFEVPAREFEGMEREYREDQLSKAVEIIRSRADGLGVAEPLIRIIGDNRIEVQLPGLSLADNPDAIDELQKPARLEFRLVHRTQRPHTTEEGEEPSGYVPMIMEDFDDDGNLIEREYFVSALPEMTGSHVTRARAMQNEMGGGWRVTLDLDSEGERLFTNLTGRIAEQNRRDGNVGLLAIVLDEQLYSAPSVRDEITGGSAQITGQFSRREARELANVLNNPLDLPLQLMERNEVGPTLAEDSIRQGVNAMLYGAIAVITFMLIYYLASGLMACITLGLNVLIILGVLSSIEATLTLPGIAGIVLTLGMAVDANILVFERIREELRAGKKLSLAVPTGFNKALSTILDANITTLLTAGILIYFGSGPVQGFGITLAIGIFTSIFGALVITRFMMDLGLRSGLLTQLKMFSFFNQTNFDFHQYRKPAIGASLTILIVGLVAVGVNRSDVLGIDFLGGEEVVLEFNPEHRLTTTEIQNAAAPIGEVAPVYQSPLGQEREVLRLQVGEGLADDLVALLQTEFPQTFGESPEIGRSLIGAAVGREIMIDAMIAILVALVGILLYVALRFEMGYGAGAVAAVVHDLLIVIGVFVLFGKQFSAPMVAGILMVVGYSLNDSIVVFDRIREELGLDPNSSLKDIINKALNKVLARTVVTSITTLLASGSLFLFGGGIIEDFSFALLVGILVGTFSSIFVASPVFYWWHKGDRRHVEERRDILPKYDWMATSDKAGDQKAVKAAENPQS